MPDLPDINALLTATQAASYAGVTPEAIMMWRKRGHLRAVSHDPNGRPLYRLIDIAKAEHATRKRARRQ